MKFPVQDRDKIDYAKPTFTFDVNVVALKPPSEWFADMRGVAELEYNYFETGLVELCVTPQTSGEIVQGVPIACLGSTVYARFKKSELFKSRPPGTTLSLTDQEADQTWGAIRSTLLPTVSDEALAERQRADVTQLFFHLTASGTLANSAFVTRDGDFHGHREEIQEKFGVQVLYPYEAWDTYQPEYGLYVPNDSEIALMWEKEGLRIAGSTR